MHILAMLSQAVPSDFAGTFRSKPKATAHLAAQVWLWELHNAVNARLSNERGEEKGELHPARQWPSLRECSACHTVKRGAVRFRLPRTTQYLRQAFCHPLETATCTRPSADRDAWTTGATVLTGVLVALGVGVVAVSVRAWGRGKKHTSPWRSGDGGGGRSASPTRRDDGTARRRAGWFSRAPVSPGRGPLEDEPRLEVADHV